MRIIARQRLLWNFFDVHRVAAVGQNFAQKIVPWFMRPLLPPSANIRPVFRLMKTVGASIIRYAEDAAAAEAAGHPERVRVHGADDRRATLRPIAENIETGPIATIRNEVIAVRPLVVDGTENLIKRIDDALTETGTNTHMSIFQWFYDLSDIGALYMIAYAAVAEEARLAEIIRDPTCADDLFELTLRPAAKPKLHETRLNEEWPYRTRALHVLAAYRCAVLFTNSPRSYVQRNVFTAEAAVAGAEHLMGDLKRGSALTKRQAAAAAMFKLSHESRFG